MVHFYTRLVTFICGVCLGFIIAKSCINETKIRERGNHPQAYSKWFVNQGYIRAKLQWDVLRYNSTLKYVTESDLLKSRINIFCVVLVVKEKNFNAGKSTWAKGCNHIKLIQVIKKYTKPFPVKRTKEGSSWFQLCQIFMELSESHEWILVVNDTTFVIMENLRYLLAPLNAHNKYYLGYAVVFWSTIYNSGQAGYVLSKGALAAFKSRFSTNDCLVNSLWNREDYHLGKHLAKVNVTPMDTRDHEGFSRFHPYPWHQVLFPGENYYKTNVFPTKCCSETSVSFEAIQGDKMYTFYYLLYVLQIFNSGHLGNRAPPPIDDEQVLKAFLKEQNILKNNLTSEEYYNIWERLIDDPKSFAAKLKREEYTEYD